VKHKMSIATKSMPFLHIFTILILLSLVSGSCVKRLSDGEAGQRNTENQGPSVTRPLSPIEGFDVYENPAYHFRIQYPAGWLKEEGSNRVSFIIPAAEPEQELKEGFNILFDIMSGLNMKLEQYTRIIIQGLKKDTPDFQLIESEICEIDAQPASRIMYTGKYHDLDIQYTSYFLIREGFLYVMNFNTIHERFHSYQDILQTIISSFQFLS
jgi:hypothetical protein